MNHKTYILEIIPLTKTGFVSSISYFSTFSPKPGEIIEVPFGKKSIPGIITQVRSAEVSKANLKNTSFTLKKISDYKILHRLNPLMLKAISRLALMHATTDSAIVRSLLPLYALRNLGSIDETESRKFEKFQTEIIQSSIDERLSRYIVEHKASRKDDVMFIVVPTKEHGSFIHHELESQTSESIIHINSKSSKNDLKNCLKALTDKTLDYIIAPPSLCMFILPYAHNVVIEFESHSYKQIYKPFLNGKDLVQKFAEEMCIPLFFADDVISPVVFHREQKHMTTKALSTALTSIKNISIIDMRKNQDNESSRDISKNSIFSTKVIERITNNSEGPHMLVALRSGYATQTVCASCEMLLACKDCNSPLVLHKHNRRYQCTNCNKQSSTEVRCVSCSSWDMRTLGIGVEKVQDELKQAYGLKSEIAHADSKISDSNIHIATPAHATHISGQFSTISVITIDGIFSVPDISIPTKVINLILKLSRQTENELLIQTRHPNYAFWEYVSKPDRLEMFHEDDLTLRSRFDYPPFSTILELSCSGKNIVRAEENRESVKKLFARYSPLMPPPYAKKGGKDYTATIIIKVPENSWPDKHIVAIVNSLAQAPWFSVNVNPERYS